MKFSISYQKRNFSAVRLMTGFVLTAVVVLACGGCGRHGKDKTDDAIASAGRESDAGESMPSSDKTASAGDDSAKFQPFSEGSSEGQAGRFSAVGETQGEVETTAADFPAVEITEDTIIDINGERFYGFANSGWAGCGLDGTVRPFELYYGIYAEVHGSALRYRAYSHLDDVEPVSAAMTRDSNGNTSELKIAVTETEIDVSTRPDDAFTISVQFSNGHECSMTVFINEGEPWIANATNETESFVRDSILSRADDLYDLVISWGITPENSTGASSSDIAYPTYAGRTDNHRCDTDLWRALAHEIVPDESLGDSVKVIMLHDWMTANLAYDKYVSDEIGKSRRNYYKLWDGTWSVYNTHAGICGDFVNIFAIMCRELGVPCSTLDSETHTWSLIWLDGRWHDLDVTYDIRRMVMGEDITDIINEDQTVTYDGFLAESFIRSLDQVISVGNCIYTEAFARGESRKTDTE